MINSQQTEIALADSGIDAEIVSARDVLTTDLICFSHLRWDFVFQRPQHLLSRFARNRRVFFFEEPKFELVPAPSLDLRISGEGVHVATPRLPTGLAKATVRHALKCLLDAMIEEHDIKDTTLWYYTPMALEFSSHLDGRILIYDCMDELSLFKDAPPELLSLEAQLMARTDLVFTGGHSLFEAKRHQHSNIHPFPSSIEFNHFAQARKAEFTTRQPEDQARIPGPRIGFFGVIDERLDIDYLEGIAWARPEWQFVMIGPVVKIDPATLPTLPNIHYLGMKNYAELPKYLSGWDIAMLPFAKNESTRFISPTKTPEYLAAGRPVISTSIRDIVSPYGLEELVEIADTPSVFIEKAARIMVRTESDRLKHQARVDAFLAGNSWDQTHENMASLEYEISAHKFGPLLSGSMMDTALGPFTQKAKVLQDGIA